MPLYLLFGSVVPEQTGGEKCHAIAMMEMAVVRERADWYGNDKRKAIVAIDGLDCPA